MNIFDFDNYLDFLKTRIMSLPKKGRGEAARLARLLNISNTAMGHILNGRNSLSSDQAFVLAKDFDFKDLEQEYFLKLVEFERASKKEFRTHLKEKLFQIKVLANNFGLEANKDIDISEKYLPQFYTDWIYSAFRLITTLDEFNTVEEICSYFQISLEKGNNILKFLVEAGLVVKDGNHLKIGPSFTHLDKNSVFVSNHHRNWRLKALNKLTEIEEDDLFYTSPFAMGESDVEWLKLKLREVFRELHQKVKDSPCETLVCLNIDLFKF